MSRGNERSIVTSVYNRIALDVSALRIEHVRLDENGRFLSSIDDGLNNCLTLEANIDQTPRSFIQDVVISMFDEGSVAIIPVETTEDPNVSGSYDILSMRVGQILEWYPQHIRTRVYNERTGRKEDIVMPKSAVAIIENPLYAVINEPNSTMQRLIRKLNILDVIDEQSGSGKLDLIIQLPYVIKTEARRIQAENRRKDIESQLSGSKYGIAYTDGTEHITQLNRSVNNNLMSQIEYLTSMLYSQLGITQSILDGTADEKTMLNYNNRTIEPIISAIVDEMKRKFLTKTARTQLQSISFFRDPFKLVPVNNIAEIADKFTRNEIMTSNEIRQVIGMKPSDDPNADELRNKNLSQPAEEREKSAENIIESRLDKAGKLDSKKLKTRSKEENQNE
jgi:phage portal protein|nr:MAG TPA: portal protein [Caudoviricetes sp.]